jgi:hypothetical protein
MTPLELALISFMGLIFFLLFVGLAVSVTSNDRQTDELRKKASSKTIKESGTRTTGLPFYPFWRK